MPLIANMPSRIDSAVKRRRCPGTRKSLSPRIATWHVPVSFHGAAMKFHHRAVPIVLAAVLIESMGFGIVLPVLRVAALIVT